MSEKVDWAILDGVQQYLDEVLVTGMSLPRDHIEQESEALIEANRSLIVDEPAEGALATCALILATYRVLLPSVGEKAAVDALAHGVQALIGADIEAYVERRFAMPQSSAGRAFELACKNFKPLGEKYFGQGWVYELEVQDEERCFVNVVQCLNRDFFLANDATQVLPALCCGDDVWAEELNKDKYNVRVEIPTTMGAGGDKCRFQFFRVPRGE